MKDIQELPQTIGKKRKGDIPADIAAKAAKPEDTKQISHAEKLASSNQQNRHTLSLHPLTEYLLNIMKSFTVANKPI